MTAILGPLDRSQGAASRPAVEERLGIVFPLLLVWIFFDFGRPPNPLKIPLLISAISFTAWFLNDQKQWTRQSWYWLGILGVMALGIPLAANNYAAFWSTRDMAVLFLSICLPLHAMVTSIRRVRLWLYTFLAVALYVGAWGATHGGYGPSGAGGGQDENYVAAHMGVAIALGYFSLFATRRLVLKVLLGAAMVVFVAAIGLGVNPSRGGFIGLCAVGLYCVARSPRKVLGFSILAAVAVALVALAGPTFWAEIGTSTDLDTGTTDLRIEIWKAGLRMWEANPLFGVGAGNFRWVIGVYQSAEQFEKFGRDLGGSVIAHSWYVEMLAELGLAGVIATFLLIWRTWTDLGRVRNDSMQRFRQLGDHDLVQFSCYADAIRAGIVAVLANGVGLSLYYYSYLWLLLALGGALVFVYRRRFPGPESAGEGVPRLGARASGSRRRGGISGPAPAIQGVRAGRGRRR